MIRLLGDLDQDQIVIQAVYPDLIAIAQQVRRAVSVEITGVMEKNRVSNLESTPEGRC